MGKKKKKESESRYSCSVFVSVSGHEAQWILTTFSSYDAFPSPSVLGQHLAVWESFYPVEWGESFFFLKGTDFLTVFPSLGAAPSICHWSCHTKRHGENPFCPRQRLFCSLCIRHHCTFPLRNKNHSPQPCDDLFPCALVQRQSSPMAVSTSSSGQLLCSWWTRSSLGNQYSFTGQSPTLAGLEAFCNGPLGVRRGLSLSSAPGTV